MKRADLIVNMKQADLVVKIEARLHWLNPAESVEEQMQRDLLNVQIASLADKLNSGVRLMLLEIGRSM
jgi:hypothetical protein